MKKIYYQPEIKIHAISLEESVLFNFSRVDNDGDGITDQYPIDDDDPEDDDIGQNKYIYILN